MTPPSYLVGTAAVTENLLKRKWSVVILRYLANGISDPTEISRREINLTTTAMNERLRNMLRYSLISRYPGVGNAKVIEYRLTTRGQKILKILQAIEQLDNEPNQQNHRGDENQIASIRQTRITSDPKQRIILKD